MWSIHPAQIRPIVDAFAPRTDEVALAAEILLAAQAADCPTRHGDTLHDRASYRYYWSVLRRARATGQPVPAEAALPAWGGARARARADTRVSCIRRGANRIEVCETTKGNGRKPDIHAAK